MKKLELDNVTISSVATKELNGKLTSETITLKHLNKGQSSGTLTIKLAKETVGSDLVTRLMSAKKLRITIEELD